ncbi:MAG: 30S ribosomal protein S20, partial [Candidatus Muiribacteriota bacterium]
MADERKRKNSPEEKRILQAQKREQRNRALRSKMKTVVKKFVKSFDSETPQEEKATLLNTAKRTIDKMVTKGIIHKNN